METGNAAAPADRVPVTVTAAIDVLRRDGYDADFELVDGRLRSEAGNSTHVTDEAVVERLYRFEGPSDPGDLMIVFGLLDPATGTRGTLATAFGPVADPVLYEHLSGFTTRFARRSRP